MTMLARISASKTEIFRGVGSADDRRTEALDARRGDPRVDHRLHRLDRRQRRIAPDPRGSGWGPGGPAMAHRRLPADPRLAAAGGRRARRSVWPAADVRARA